MKKFSILITTLVLYLASLACQTNSNPNVFLQTEHSSVIYTELGSPDNLDVAISRMQSGEQVCYLAGGGINGNSISCLSTSQIPSGDKNNVIFTDLGSPNSLDIAISRMQDSNQTCYIIGGSYSGLSISCPNSPVGHTDNEETTFIDLDSPDNMDIVVVEMKDGNQLCYISATNRLVSISCH